MQINIDKKTGVFSGVIVALVAIIFFLVVGNDDASDSDGMNHSNMHNQTSSPQSSMSGSDAMFFQMMIPHHQQAVDISNLALEKSKDPELLALAKEIRDGQAAEIKQMEKWLTDNGENLTAGHDMGHEMGGMLSDDDLSKLNSLSGTAFDIFWLKGMIGHHDGALHMVTMITDSNQADFRSFAGSIDSLQSEQIAQMKKMLVRLEK
jgi:uncharacterized protein (DUF305 family)